MSLAEAGGKKLQIPLIRFAHPRLKARAAKALGMTSLVRDFWELWVLGEQNDS